MAVSWQQPNTPRSCPYHDNLAHTGHALMTTLWHTQVMPVSWQQLGHQVISVMSWQLDTKVISESWQYDSMWLYTGLWNSKTLLCNCTVETPTCNSDISSSHFDYISESFIFPSLLWRVSLGRCDPVLLPPCTSACSDSPMIQPWLSVAPPAACVAVLSFHGPAMCLYCYLSTLTMCHSSTAPLHAGLTHCDLQ